MSASDSYTSTDRPYHAPETNAARIERPALGVAVSLLDEHFGGSQAYFLPWSQRAYAWDEELAATLLSDIIAAMDSEQKHYYLGRVLLADSPEKERLALIDGHQRTLTLTIIFALLRDRAPTPAEAADMTALLEVTAAAARPVEAVSEPWRVTTQPAIADFVAQFVQAPGATMRDPDDTDEAPSQTETTILQNRSRLSSRLDDFIASDNDWRRLSSFLRHRCYVVVNTAPSVDAAWAMLSLEETKGLPFHSIERLKVTLISTLPRDMQEEAGLKWQKWQAALGADGLQNLLHHVRAMLIGRRSTKPIEQDLIAQMRRDGSYAPLFDQHIAPHVENYRRLRTGDFGSWTRRSRISGYVETMNWLERDFWVTPALRWLSVHGADHPETEAFFKRLERISWMLRISSNDPVQHERHFLRISRAIGPDTALGDLSDLEISEKTRKDTLHNLLSRTFFDKKYSRLILRRLSARLGADPGDINSDKATVEHILPRSPKSEPSWRKDFRQKDAVKDNVNRLGNLAVLTLPENQKAGTKSYAEKRQILKRSTFRLARHAAAHAKWTPDVIRKRSQDLVDLLFEEWELPSR